MSALLRPRIHFGGTFETNVGTGNNDDVPDRPEQVVDTASVTVHPPAGMGDDDFRLWMQGLTPGTRRLRAGWNYYGDNGCGFPDATVVSVEGADGPTPATAKPDPLVGAKVVVTLGVMADLDPKGYANTQILAHSLQVLGDKGLGFTGTPTRFHSRWVNFTRNLTVGGFAGASAVFQASMPKASIQWNSTASAALKQFRKRVDAAAGISVRICLYLLSPAINDQDLAARYAAGELIGNPATGRVVGTLGVWPTGTPASVSMGRLLVPSGSTIANKVQVTLGSAVAAVDSNARRVTLDLVNTFPEQDASGAKVPLGAAVLAVRTGTEIVDIGPVPYDQATYERTSGIVEVPFTAELAPTLAGGDLLLKTANGDEMLAEAPVMIESDDRNVYLQQGEAVTIALGALARGRPLVTPVPMFVLDEPGTGAHLPVVDHPAAVSAGPAGVEIPLRATNPGCVVLRLAATSKRRALDPARDTYISVRVLPADDYSKVPDDKLTFQFVYQEVFRYYHLLHPAMSAILDLSDQDIAVAMADNIVARTATALWPNAAYMPRTRELSEGKRRLLERWARKTHQP